MTIKYACSFDHYGPATFTALHAATAGWFSDNTIFLGDGWVTEPNYNGLSNSNGANQPNGQYSFSTPSWGARRGDVALVANAVAVNAQRTGPFTTDTYVRAPTASMRLAIPGASAANRKIHLAFSTDTLPTTAGMGYICDFLNTNGVRMGSLRVNASGRLEIVDGGTLSANDTGLVATPTSLALTSGPVISASTWYSININLTVNGIGNVDIDIYVGDIIPANLVLTATALAFTDPGDALPNVDILGILPASMTGSNDVLDVAIRACRDIVLSDATGTYNTGLLGQVFVSAQQMRAEDNEGSNWQAFPRENIGTGIIDCRTQDGLYVSDNAALELGAGDFTLEGWFKLDTINISPNETVLLSKWDEGSNLRSWKLEYDDATGFLRFVISTDGTAETTLFSYPFVPEKQKYYHIAVCRNTAVTRVFVNGVQIGMDKADSNTYFDGAAVVGVMGRFDGTTIDAGTAADGWVDEVRITVGVGRYTTDFAVPTTPFGRNVTDDTDYNSVELLIGGDGAIVDESSNAFTVVAGAGTVTQEPDDSSTSYEVLNQRPAWDDSFIEASNTFADNILELSANPADGETVTLGSKTYTFKTTLTPVANEVLIGATAADSLFNLVQACNAGTGSGTLYAAGTTVNADVFGSTLPDEQALFTATAIGTAGNSVVTTETLANGFFIDGGTMVGGQDIPTPSDFAIERLPVDVTGVLGVQVTARGYKSDAGTANLRFDLKGPSAAIATGTAQGTDLSPQWLRQIFEEDPDTVATITPSTITGGRVRVTRTT